MVQFEYACTHTQNAKGFHIPVKFYVSRISVSLPSQNLVEIKMLDRTAVKTNPNFFTEFTESKRKDAGMKGKRKSRVWHHGHKDDK